MTKRKLSVEDAMVLRARLEAPKMLDRLLEIANDPTGGHPSIKACEVVLRLAQEKTTEERDPLGLDFFSRS